MDWLRDWLNRFKDWLIDLLLWLPLKLLDLFLKAVLAIIDAIPLPSFIQDITLANLISAEIVWLLHQSGVSAALGIISGAIVFRILRKLLTLGIWS